MHSLFSLCKKEADDNKKQQTIFGGKFGTKQQFNPEIGANWMPDYRGGKLYRKSPTQHCKEPRIVECCKDDEFHEALYLCRVFTILWSTESRKCIGERRR